VQDYLTAAGAILTVEARHQAVISEIDGELGFPSPFDTPLEYNDVYSVRRNATSRSHPASSLRPSSSAARRTTSVRVATLGGLC